MWSKEFIEAGKQRLAGNTDRQATSDEVKELRRVEFVKQRLKVIGILDQVPSFRTNGRTHSLTNNP